MDRLVIWSLLSIVTGFVPPQYQPIIRGARRIISLTPVFGLYPGQEQLLNNTLREGLKLTTRQLLAAFMTTKLFNTQVGAFDLCVSKCMGEGLFPTPAECASYCKGEVMAVTRQVFMENSFSDLAAHIPTPPDIANKTMQVAVLVNRTLDLTVRD